MAELELPARLVRDYQTAAQLIGMRSELEDQSSLYAIAETGEINRRFTELRSSLSAVALREPLSIAALEPDSGRLPIVETILRRDEMMGPVFRADHRTLRQVKGVVSDVMPPDYPGALILDTRLFSAQHSNGGRYRVDVVDAQGNPLVDIQERERTWRDAPTVSDLLRGWWTRKVATAWAEE